MSRDTGAKNFAFSEVKSRYAHISSPQACNHLKSARVKLAGLAQDLQNSISNKPKTLGWRFVMLELSKLASYHIQSRVQHHDSNLQVLVRSQPPFIISFPAFAPPPDSIPPRILDNTHNNQVHATYGHQVWNTTWGTDKLFYLTFALRNVPLAGELRCLQGDFKMFPVKHEQSGWMLDSALSERWSDLEKFLKLLCADIPALQSTNWHILLPLSFCNPEWPSQYGYTQSYPSEQQLRQAMRSSCNAFFLWLAYLGFLLACTDDGHLVSLGGPKWYDEMKKREGPFFINQVDFFVRLFTSGNSQVGCFIDRTAKQQWFDYIPLLLQFSIPFWVFWGNTLPNKNEVHRDLVDLLPSDRSIQHANAEWEEFLRVNPQYRVPTPPRLAAVRLGLEYHAVNTPSRPVASVPLFPPPIRWHEVFSAPAESSTTTSLPPTASTTTASLPPVSYGTLTKHFPGEHPEEYFRRLAKWAKSEKPPGKNRPFVFKWEPAETEEKSYVHCRLVRSEVNEMWAMYSQHDIIYNSFVNCFDLFRPPNCPAHVSKDLFDDEGPITRKIEADMAHHDDDPLAIEPIYEDFWQVIKNHFGLVENNCFRPPRCQSNEESWMYSRIALTFGSSLKTSLIWPIDMFPSKARRYPLPSFMKNPVLVGSNCVFSQAIGSSKSIPHRAQSKSLNGTSLREIAAELIRRGILFHILVPPSSQPSFPAVLHCVKAICLGSHRYLDNLKGLYSTYCSTLDSIFSSSHVRWAALIQGGLIWRLTLEYSIMDVVLSGPLEDANRDGHTQSFSSGQIKYVKNFLTEDEADYISGIYHLEKRSDGQAAHVS
ncbi:hypothetical protein C8Q75DRAFT_808305 [Abortiporus biennis]|nr:hypothetical protein C8Q75DRAFT_808305 [Abortiporus biennis]